MTSATAALAIQEIDPNNTCALAQNIGALSPNATFTVNGALKTPPTVPDIDFYRFTGGTPGDLLQVTVSGVSDGVDTLTLPLVGVLNSSCGITFNSGSYEPISFEVTVPADGIVVLAVTSCCDFGFSGAGSYAGSYTLAVTEVVPVQSISGRAVDSVTLQPIPGVEVQLTLCPNPTCLYVLQEGFTSTDSLGQFTFTNNFGAPLPPGTYQVTLYDFQGRYEVTVSPRFPAASGEQKVVADVPMLPVPVIGSISGRIIDSVTRAPLSGVSAPHAHIELSGCSASGNRCSFVSGYTDSAGRFVFTRDQSGLGIVANTFFNMVVGADQYQQLFSATTTGAAGVNQDLGDIQLVSNPVRFTVLQGCSNVPLTGGVCQYKVQITNGIAKPVEGEAWATINAFGLGSFVGSSLFQTGEPQEMYLAGATATTQASRIASFQFEIPGTVSPYAFICPTFWFGTGDANAQLYTQGMAGDPTDCVQRTATGYAPATPEQIEGLRKEHHDHEAKERTLVAPKH